MSNTSIIILSVLGSISLLAGVMFVLVSFFKRQMREEMQTNQEQYIKLAAQQFEANQNKAVTELETRKLAVENSVAGLKEELAKYQQMMREFEQDRQKKYGNLETELKNASQATSQLQDSTTRLNNILGNVKLRGQWGERMAEDIIRNAGLIEGVNYTKQTQLGASNTKPDFTFLLPSNQSVNMDVKFPLDNYLKMINTEEEFEKESYQKEFVKNVKERVKEIQNRDYINPAENTLDFVLLFIPNEQVYGLIQEMIPEMMDIALSQKVVLCSPFTLYAMLSVIRQAHENFRFEKDMKKIMLLVDQFSKIYDKFKTRFDDIGKSITKLEQQYTDVAEKSFKNLDTKIRHIEDHKRGKLPELINEEDVIDIPERISNDAFVE